MSRTKRDRLRWRPLLTDTLPYEVPVIFSNDRLYAALVANFKSVNVESAFTRLTQANTTWTIPYSYTITKSEGSSTDLALVHPIIQMHIAEFYDQYAQTILESCKKSKYTLRRPVDVASMAAENISLKEGVHKLGIQHIDPDEGEIDVSRLSSFFAYGNYNLLHKFYDSPEFMKLEKGFSHLRTLDVTKCFFNIYTHTVTWAVKERYFAKEFRNHFSFEGRFDVLMQRSNNNETNGIVVGPEFSRVFAEIIFQDIDKKIASEVKVLGERVSIRRYVDDYMIFANSDHDLDIVERAIRKHLSGYKLFLNERKTATYRRPFVSSITLARAEISSVLMDLPAELKELMEATDEKSLRRVGRNISQRIQRIRLIVAGRNVGFHTISGWLLATLKGSIRNILTLTRGASDDHLEAIADVLNSIVSVSFYVCAVDLRVRTSYSICQIVALVQSFNRGVNVERYDRIEHTISQELQGLISSVIDRALGADALHEQVELANILICGAHYLGAGFVRSSGCRKALSLLTGAEPLSYFGFIAAKFCYLKSAEFSADLQQLNARAIARVSSGSNAMVSAECYLMLCDILASPDVDVGVRRELYRSACGGTLSNVEVEELELYVGFADWKGMRIEHTLARKDLRPMYAWS